MQEQGWDTLPSAGELRKHGYSALNNAIHRYYGGMNQFRTTLGQQNPDTKPPGYWQKEENVLAEARQAMEEHGWAILPSNKELRKHRYSSLNDAMCKYHGGIQNIRTKLGQQNPNTKPQGYWKSLENTIAETRQAMAEQGWSALPSSNDLKKHGYSSLSAAIIKHHGGIRTFRTKLGQTNPNIKPKRYWQSLENTLKEAQQAMEKHGWGTLPAQEKLRKHGYNSLHHAITFHGGIQNIRGKLGQTNTKKPHGYWQKLENTITEAQRAMQKHGWGTLPSSDVLVKNGYSSLSQAITNYHGRITTFRTLLLDIETGKTPKQQLEQLLDEYIAA